MKEVHQLAIFVHGALAALHTLGIVYNIRKKNWWQTACHVGGTVFSAHAAVHHGHEARHGDRWANKPV